MTVFIVFQLEFLAKLSLNEVEFLQNLLNKLLLQVHFLLFLLQLSLQTHSSPLEILFLGLFNHVYFLFDLF